MASTVPVKSRSLHNLSLPHLKWKRGEHSAAHPRSLQSPPRRPNAAPHSPRRRSPLRRHSVSATPSRDSPVGGDYLLKRCRTSGESSGRSHINDWRKQSKRQFPNSETEILGKSKCFSMEYSGNQSRYSGFNGVRIGVCSSDSAQAKDKTEKKSEEIVVDLANKRSKILIKIPCKNSALEAVIPEESPLKRDNCNNNDQHHGVQDERKVDNNIDEELEVKKWNLRPRRPILESKKANVSRMPEPLMNANKPKGKAGNCSGAGERKEKRTLSISVSLSKEEIEEDIYALTGSKPARRPRKRAKQIQRQVDFVFPGLWLVSVSRDSYKVSASSLMG